MQQLNEQLWMQQVEDYYLIGVTPAFQCDAGDITFAQIAELGEIECDDTLLNVEASKAAIEVPMPFTATIIERNEQAEANPSLLDSPESANNWVVKVKDIQD
ncbi:glycine cleavage system protein H [Aerococcaceae bacterium NML210727]|nr:glycine cleavage system protein H [Aerococcaceae bacterium NML210727]MCW6654970.1 glycine cleavage system protein H [Aerococcaceae bacterium NML201296]MCW6663431.1 glycine cleavage system protein H [Aerococcaceae bacterium NML190073]MCW6680617.1 glycine cleavage system protein H [Aerococcaceae bacterium NML130460]